MKRKISYVRVCAIFTALFIALSAFFSASALYSAIVNSNETLVSGLKNAYGQSSIVIMTNVKLTEDVAVATSLRISGAQRIDTTEHQLLLASADAVIVADGEIRVGSALEGYRVERQEGRFNYSLVQLDAPTIDLASVGCKEEITDEARYLFLDIAPSGMPLDELAAHIKFSDMLGCSVELTAENNDGNGLLKNGDCVQAFIYDENGACVAQTAYTLIVLGDINCNGRINSSDAAVLNGIISGMDCSLEVRLAADVNFSGTIEEPKVNNSDAAYIMNKCFAWAEGTYITNI